MCTGLDCGDERCRGVAVPTTAIRARTDADLEACVAFLRPVHETAGYPVNWPADPDAWLTPPDALGSWVATADARVVGHVALTFSGPGAVLVERFFVDPEETGAGLGRRLLDHCVTVAAERGVDLSLQVADNCHAAIELYRRAGWRQTGIAPIDWGGDHASTVLLFAPPG
jgi:ribosomal-protein-alanine N-acetyltransferase